MAPTIGERLQQFREVQSNVMRLRSEKQSFKQQALQCQLAAATRVQEVVTGLQESETLEQETALSQELRKLADEAMARAQEAERLANIVEAEVQRAQELAAYFERKVVHFHNRDEATVIAEMQREYQITFESRSSFRLDPGENLSDLRRYARHLGIIK